MNCSDCEIGCGLELTKNTSGLFQIIYFKKKYLFQFLIIFLLFLFSQIRCGMTATLSARDPGGLIERVKACMRTLILTTR